jgi:DNA adenine methylase
MPKNILLSPVLKWVGGKRQLLDEIIPRIGRKYSNYIEPFLGGGAVLFELQPKKAIVNDYNSELINVYKVIRDNPGTLIELLQEHEMKNSEEYYYEIRGLDRTSEFEKIGGVEKAARILYLNKTCYNGLYRVNSAGQFNSPYGRYKKPNIVNATVIKAMSKYFNESEIEFLNDDYRVAMARAKKGAFVYLDPPYMPISSSSSFTGYTESGFGYAQQVELKEECDKLRNREVSFLLSNSDCAEIRELYREYDIITVQAKRTINSKANKRGEINEVLISYGKK